MTAKQILSKSLDEIHGSVKTFSKGSFLKKFLAFSGPAYLVSVGYMDPGNWATDIAGGSQFGYKLLWILLMSNLMALLLQSLSARLGLVTGLDLAQASRQQYPTWINLSLFGFAQVAIIACDLAEVLGFAIGLKLLTGLDLIWGVAISVFDTFLILILQRYGIRKLEAFIISLVGIIGLSFLTELFLSKPHIPDVVTGFIPTTLSSEALLIAIGIIGATVMPHNLYLHSALVQTRKVDVKDNAHIKTALKFNFIDSTIALNLAFFVNAGILILSASAFFANGLTDVADIAQAHHLLDGILGTSLAPILFAVALIASGQSSTVTGTLAGQIIMEGYLNLKMKPWLRRLLTRSLAIIPAVITLLIFGENKLTALLVLSQVVLSMQLGFAVVPLIHFVSNKKIMGKFAIATWVKILAWISAAIIITLNLKLVVDNLSGWLMVPDAWHLQIFKYLTLSFFGFVIFLLIMIIVKPFFVKAKYDKFTSS
jgi:manganese transport protein